VAFLHTISCLKAYCTPFRWTNPPIITWQASRHAINIYSPTYDLDAPQLIHSGEKQKPRYRLSTAQLRKKGYRFWQLSIFSKPMSCMIGFWFLAIAEVSQRLNSRITTHRVFNYIGMMVTSAWKGNSCLEKQFRYSSATWRKLWRTCPAPLARVTMPKSQPDELLSCRSWCIVKKQRTTTIIYRTPYSLLFKAILCPYMSVSRALQSFSTASEAV